MLYRCCVKIPKKVRKNFKTVSHFENIQFPISPHLEAKHPFGLVFIIIHYEYIQFYPTVAMRVHVEGTDAFTLVATSLLFQTSTESWQENHARQGKEGVSRLY